MTSRSIEAALADARAQFLAGELRGAAVGALEVSEQAQRAGRPDLVGSAALVDEGIPDPSTAPMTEQIARDALRIGTDDDATRARVLAQLSMALHHRERFEESERAAREASDAAHAASLAGGRGAAEARIAAANARLLELAGRDPGPGMLELAGPMAADAIATGSPLGELHARNWHIAAAMRLADLATVAHEVDSLDVLAARSGLPLVRWNAVFARAGLDHARGRFREADAEARVARMELPDSQRHQTEPLFIAQVMLIATDRGLEPPEIELARAVAVGAPVIHAVMTARFDLEFGDRASAEATFDAFRPRLEHVALDRRGLAALVAGLELAVAFGDREVVARLLARLRPFDGGMVASAIGAIGPVAHFLGRGELLLGRHDAAIEHGEAAVRLAALGGFEPWHARASLTLAEALVARGARGDLPRARQLATLAATAAGKLSMRRLKGSARDVETHLDPATRLTRRERDVARFIALGESNRGIADRLGLSERTVETHVQHVMTKLGLHARTQVAAWAVGTGIAHDAG